MSSEVSNSDWGKLVLRLSIGGMMLCHGIGKIIGGVDPVVNMVKGVGLPGFIAYGVYVGEVVAPVLLIIGYFTRPAALVLAFTMVTAILLAHSGDIFKLSDHGGWGIETPALFLFGGVAIACLGGGRLAISKG